MCLDVCSEFKGVYICETRCVMSESDKIHACRDACQASFSATCDRVSFRRRHLVCSITCPRGLPNAGFVLVRWLTRSLCSHWLCIGVPSFRTWGSRRVRILHGVHGTHLHGHVQAILLISPVRSTSIHSPPVSMDGNKALVWAHPLGPLVGSKPNVRSPRLDHGEYSLNGEAAGVRRRRRRLVRA